MNDIKLSVAVFCGPERDRWIHPVLALWLNHLALSVRYIYLDCIYGKEGVEYARNSAVEVFLPRDAEWLCMVDNDMTPGRDTLEVLKEAPAPCVIAPFSYKWSSGANSFSLTCGHFDGKGGVIPLHKDIAEGLNEVDAVGTGLVFIHRETLAALGQPYFKMTRDTKTQRALVGEDYDFCFRAKRAGFKVYADSRYVVGHAKTFDMLDLHEAFAAYGRRVEQVVKDEARVKVYDATEIPKAVKE